jgi:ferredoxin--NADP+ reductase
MFEITRKQELAPKIKLFEVKAPEIAAKSSPGQFIILNLGDKGERVPLTIADYNASRGTLAFVFNEVGKTTKQLGSLSSGDVIPNIAGPLGVPSEIRTFGRVLCVGGGVMTAPLHLQAKALRQARNEITSVVGARIKDLLIFEPEMRDTSHELYIATDDGSEGFKGLSFLDKLLKEKSFQRAVVMGPVATMKTVSEMTRPYGIPTIVTLTPIMIDGMGMCGVCRVSVAGETRFACVDGPEFDGHQVDFDELVKRQRLFLPEERLSHMLAHKLGGGCHG